MPIMTIITFSECTWEPCSVALTYCSAKGCNHELRRQGISTHVVCAIGQTNFDIFFSHEHTVCFIVIVQVHPSSAETTFVVCSIFVTILRICTLAQDVLNLTDHHF